MGCGRVPVCLVGFNSAYCGTGVTNAIYSHSVSDEFLALRSGAGQLLKPALGWVDARDDDVMLASCTPSQRRHTRPLVDGGFASPPQLDRMIPTTHYGDGVCAHRPTSVLTDGEAHASEASPRGRFRRTGGDRTAALLAGIDCATLPAIHQERVAGGSAMMDLRTALTAVPLLLLASGAFAQKQGGVLRVYHNDNPPTASLHEEVTISTLMPFMALFNNLASYDQTVKRNADDTIVADLAESWSWSPDNKDLTFRLRQGAKWHDGKPFTSADVKCTWDNITGKRESGWRKNPRKEWYNNLQLVTTEGDFQVTFHLGRPQPSFLSFLAAGFSAVYPCHVSGADMRSRPIGTGPFKLKEFKSKQSISLVRNPDYFKKGKPHLDGIEWRMVPNLATRVLAFGVGEFDLTFSNDISERLIAEIKAKSPQAVCELNQFNIQTQLLVNSSTPPFDDPRLKKAMMLTLDRKAFIDTLSGGADRIGGVMEAPPEGVWGVGPEQLADIPGFGGDVQKNRGAARQIMKEMGYGSDKPLKVKVLARNLPLYRDPAVLLIDQFKQIHIEGELETIESALWYTRLMRKDYNVAMNTGGSALDDPDVMFYEAYACGSERNYTNYCNKTMQARFDEQSSTVDPAERKKLVQKIDYDLQALGVRPSIMHTRANTCWHPWVRGLALANNSQYNHWRLEDVWLDR